LADGGTGDCTIGDGSGDAWPKCLTEPFLTCVIGRGEEEAGFCCWLRGRCCLFCGCCTGSEAMQAVALCYIDTGGAVGTGDSPAVCTGPMFCPLAQHAPSKVASFCC